MHPLAFARERRNWSQHRLAELARTSRSIIANLEAGRRDVSARALVRILDVLRKTSECDAQREQDEILQAIRAADPLDGDDDPTLDLPAPAPVCRAADLAAP
jgi:transcriptional regulator with XRE-family HTH domain